MASHMNDNDALVKALRRSNDERSEERKIIETCMEDGNYYWCGWCRSLIPIGYTHKCDDNGTYTESG